MDYEVEVDGRLRKVTVHRAGAAFAVEMDGHAWLIDTVRIDAQTLSLIVSSVSRNGDSGGPGGASHEVAVSPGGGPGRLLVHVGPTPVPVTLNGRRRRRDESAASGDGPERIAAPMPGKVVRVLVQVGDAVGARQPLIVVEAMKMENELRAGRPGTVSEIHVKEGASVDAGALLMVIGRDSVRVPGSSRT